MKDEYGYILLLFNSIQFNSKEFFFFSQNVGDNNNRWNDLYSCPRPAGAAPSLSIIYGFGGFSGQSSLPASRMEFLRARTDSLFAKNTVHILHTDTV